MLFLCFSSLCSPCPQNIRQNTLGPLQPKCLNKTGRISFTWEQQKLRAPGLTSQRAPTTRRLITTPPSIQAPATLPPAPLSHVQFLKQTASSPAANRQLPISLDTMAARRPASQRGARGVCKVPLTPRLHPGQDRGSADKKKTKRNKTKQTNKRLQEPEQNHNGVSPLKCQIRTQL